MRLFRFLLCFLFDCHTPEQRVRIGETIGKSDRDKFLFRFPYRCCRFCGDIAQVGLAPSDVAFAKFDPEIERKK